MNPELRFKDQDGNAFPDWEEKKIDKVCRIQTGSGNTQYIHFMFVPLLLNIVINIFLSVNLF